jgi:hypothetical protein
MSQVGRASPAAEASIADMDAFALLRSLRTLTPDLVNERATPRIVDFLQRMHQRNPTKRVMLLDRPSPLPMRSSAVIKFSCILRAGVASRSHKAIRGDGNFA